MASSLKQPLLSTEISDSANAGPDWDFGGWGSLKCVDVVKKESHLVSTEELRSGGARKAPRGSHEEENAAHPSLGQYRATAIAGNDLLSSCLYTAGVCATSAGPMAPIALALVAIMLYFFRFVYSEVVTAMPANGGSYQALLNTTSKPVAAIAACLSLVSYVATAVVSAYDCVEYVTQMVDLTRAEVTLCTLGVLLIFALLTLMGIKDSANVAVVMFFFHVITLSILLVWSIVFAAKDNFRLFVANWKVDYPDLTSHMASPSASAGLAVLFGYASALLGITGFETAANYVEEMKDGKTYVVTLRNMWVAAAFYNPLISLAAMAVMPMYPENGNYNNPLDSHGNPMKAIITADSQSSLLANMGYVIGGSKLRTLVAVDGALVLAGSVLTAYVGVTGLVRRMSLDRCFPEFLLAVNKWRGSAHWIIIGFFGLTSLLFLATSGNPDTAMTTLGAVYAIAFLSVMSAFAISCIILKWKRPDLPRLVITRWGTVLTALAFVLIGLGANIASDPANLEFFFLFFGTALVIVLTMFNRTRLLRILLRVLAQALADSRAKKQARARTKALQDAHRKGEERRLHGDDRKSIIGLTITPTEDDARISRRLSGALLETLAQSMPFKPVSVGGGSVEMTAPQEAQAYTALPDAPMAPAGPAPRDWRGRILAAIARGIESINSQPVVYFAKSGDLTTLNKAVQYVRTNEQTARLCVVHVVDDRDAIRALQHLRRSTVGMMSRETSEGPHSPVVPRSPVKTGQANGAVNTAALALTPVKGPLLDAFAAGPAMAVASEGASDIDFQATLDLITQLPPLPDSAKLLAHNVALLDAVYPKVRIDCLIVRGSFFSPAVIQWLSRYLGVTTNMMFMAMPDERFPHQFASMGGVRVITRAGTKEQRQAAEQHLEHVLRQVAQAYREPQV